jgi:hypothetical protein
MLIHSPLLQERQRLQIRIKIIKGRKREKKREANITAIYSINYMIYIVFGINEYELLQLVSNNQILSMHSRFPNTK